MTKPFPGPALAALAALALGACGAPDSDSPGAESGAQAAPGNHFPQYRPAAAGGRDVFMEEGVSGRLALRGRCLGLLRHGGFATIIWHPDARLGADEEGPFVALPPFTFRIGDHVSGSGGGVPLDLAGSQLTAPFPTECRPHGAIELHGLDYANPLTTPRPPDAPPQ